MRLAAAAPATLPPPEDRIPAGATLLRPADDFSAIIASAPVGLGGWAGRSALSRRPGRRRASLVEAAGGGLALAAVRNACIPPVAVALTLAAGWTYTIAAG